MTGHEAREAREAIEAARQTHVEWRDYWQSNPHGDCEGCDRERQITGDAARHERYIAEYDNVLAVLADRDAARAALARVEALHRRDSTRAGWCDNCGLSWPCPTVRALAGDA